MAAHPQLPLPVSARPAPVAAVRARQGESSQTCEAQGEGSMRERFSLDGKIAIVTGAGRGLGREMALALARAGADIVCAARTPEQIEQTAGQIRALGRQAITV